MKRENRNTGSAPAASQKRAMEKQVQHLQPPKRVTYKDRKEKAATRKSATATFNTIRGSTQEEKSKIPELDMRTTCG